MPHPTSPSSRPAPRALLLALVATAGLALACGGSFDAPPAADGAPAAAPADATIGTAGQQPGPSGVIDESTPPAPQKPPAETPAVPEAEEPGAIKGG